MPTIIDGTLGLTTPTYGGADTAEYLVPVTQFKNRIINGAMVINQRGSTDGYPVDRFINYQGGGGSFTIAQSSIAPSGFINSSLLTVNIADSSIAASDFYVLRQNIEGLNVADLGWGTANAATVTLSFWVRSSVTGTYAGGLSNSAFNRSYVFTYSISSANTWEYKTVTIAGDTTGTWLTNNGIGISVNWDLGSGSNSNGTANAWSAGDFRRTSGSVNWIATNGATFYITGVQLEVGSTATSFDYRPYGTELALCQRYYEKSFNIATAPTSANAATIPPGLFTTAGSAGGLTTNYLDGCVQFSVSKRGNPTMSFFDAAGNSGRCERTNPGVAATNNQNIGASSIGNASFQVSSTSGANAGRFAFYWMADSEL